MAPRTIRTSAPQIPSLDLVAVAIFERTHKAQLAKQPLLCLSRDIRFRDGENPSLSIDARPLHQTVHEHDWKLYSLPKCDRFVG